jgi:hypothetical protein
MRLIPPRRVFALSVLLLPLNGCPQKTAIWVRPDSRPDSLVFGLGKARGHEEAFQFLILRVDHCEAPGRGSYLATPLWLIDDPLDGSVREPYPTRIRYGFAPPGFHEEAPAASLSPGCYVASIIGTGRTAFRVDSTGAIQPLDQAPPVPSSKAPVAAMAG